MNHHQVRRKRLTMSYVNVESLELKLTNIRPRIMKSRHSEFQKHSQLVIKRGLQSHIGSFKRRKNQSMRS